jgi:glycine cleavage system H protein
VRVEGSEATIGLTAFGQDLAGEIVYVEMPLVGREVAKDDAFMSMESGKWVGRIKAPVSGKVTAANEELEWESTTVNEDPYGEGWLAKLEIGDPSELDDLMRADSDEYAALIAAEREKYDK